jgi:hypothetical protein
MVDMPNEAHVAYETRRRLRGEFLILAFSE